MVMNNSAEPSRNVQHNNAQHAVLFEAISLAIHLDTNSPLVDTAAVLLARFISSKETNVRYLGLDTMAHLAARADTLDPLKKHQGTIILSLRDKDISVRRRALDLLYSMCDVDNSELIVGELLRYLKVADYALREELVLKIAILTEKYASSYKWYVDTILQLISAAGDHVGDEVWYRVVQIVTNTEDLQEYAARVVFEHLKTPATHESLVKVGGMMHSSRPCSNSDCHCNRLYLGRIWTSHCKRTWIQPRRTVSSTTLEIALLRSCHTLSAPLYLCQMGQCLPRAQAPAGQHLRTL